MNPQPVPPPTVLVLAAGAGQRFLDAGGTCHKLQAPLTIHGRTQAVLDHVLDAVRQSGLPFHVVRPEHTAHHATQGMGTSIATGVAATADATGWLILPGDLPWIQAHSLLATAHLLQTGADAVQVQVNGQRAHPVGFAKHHGPALQALRGDDGAKGVLRGLAVERLTLEDEGCLRDVDRPGDFFWGGTGEGGKSKSLTCTSRA